MARASSPLPERLQYLEPVRKQLAALPPGEVHEYTDLSKLRKAVRKRVLGMSNEEASALLQQDTVELEQWLATTGTEHVHLHFLLPILPDAVEMLLSDEEPDGTWERGEATMELPTGAKIRNTYGSIEAQWGKLRLSLHPLHPAEALHHIARLREEAQVLATTPTGTTTIAEVQFGPVTGIKQTSLTKHPNFDWKYLSYVFTAPGGQLLVIVQTKNIKTGYFDETEVESLFHTLKVLNYAPPSPVNPPA